MDNTQIPEGTIIVSREGGVKKLYYIEDLMFMNELLIGHVFNAVAGYYDKTPADYGAKWIKFLNQQWEVSNAFKFMQKEIASCKSDYEKILLVCKHLGEEDIMSIPVAELK